MTTIKKKKKVDVLNILIVLILIVGWYILMFPSSADLLNKIYNQNTIRSYNSTMSSYTDEELQQMLEECQKYNETIYEEQQQETFRYRGPTATDETYESLPTKAKEIGTIRIPKIDINVGISHGTTENDLQAEAGHWYGSSLPVEGENVHAIIAAHSALTNARLFTDLGKLDEGDSFYITVLNREYEYKVVEIDTILPTDETDYIQIEEGKNLVTLYTCTPYGVNTHRLLVKGELVGSKEVDLQDGGFELSQYMDTIKYASLLALIILAPFILMNGYRIYLNQKNKDKNRPSRKKKKKATRTNQKEVESSREENHEEIREKENN